MGDILHFVLFAEGTSYKYGPTSLGRISFAKWKMWAGGPKDEKWKMRRL